MLHKTRNPLIFGGFFVFPFHGDIAYSCRKKRRPILCTIKCKNRERLATNRLIYLSWFLMTKDLHNGYGRDSDNTKCTFRELLSLIDGI